MAHDEPTNQRRYQTSVVIDLRKWGRSERSRAAEEESRTNEWKYGVKTMFESSHRFVSAVRKFITEEVRVVQHTLELYLSKRSETER